MAQRIRSGVISTLTALVVFAAGALLASLLVRSITAPMQQAVDTANAIAAKTNSARCCAPSMTCRPACAAW